jgi:hypothetical protein
VVLVVEANRLRGGEDYGDGRARVFGLEAEFAGCAGDGGVLDALEDSVGSSESGVSLRVTVRGDREKDHDYDLAADGTRQAKESRSRMAERDSTIADCGDSLE